MPFRFSKSAESGSWQHVLDEDPGSVDDLQAENQALRTSLDRATKQLSIVQDITDSVTKLRSPEAIREALLRRLGDLFRASAVYRWTEAGITVHHANQPALIISPEALEATLQDLSPSRFGLRGSRLLQLNGDGLGLVHPTTLLVIADRVSPDVCECVIFYRDVEAPRFTPDDVRAAEATLTYRSHLLANIQLMRDLHAATFGMVSSLTAALEAKDPYTAGHSARVGFLARLTAAELGLTLEQQQRLEWAGLLHDIGKIGVPEGILNKPGGLSPDEFAQIKRHPRLSYEMLRPVMLLQPVIDAVLYHHENHDGSGYPEGLADQEIPLGARIIHAVDVFDALTSDRAYRRKFTPGVALDILVEGAGSQTDPAVLTAFLAGFRRYLLERPDDLEQRFEQLANSGALSVDELDRALQQLGNSNGTESIRHI